MLSKDPLTSRNHAGPVRRPRPAPPLRPAKPAYLSGLVSPRSANMSTTFPEKTRWALPRHEVTTLPSRHPRAIMDREAWLERSRLRRESEWREKNATELLAISPRHAKHINRMTFEEQLVAVMAAKLGGSVWNDWRRAHPPPPSPRPSAPTHRRPPAPHHLTHI